MQFHPEAHLSAKYGQKIRLYMNSLMKKAYAPDKQAELQRMATNVAALLSGGDETVLESRTLSSLANLFIDPESSQIDENFARFIEALARGMITQKQNLDQKEKNLETLDNKMGRILASKDQAQISFKDVNAWDLHDNQRVSEIKERAKAKSPSDDYELEITLPNSQEKLKFTASFVDKNSPGQYRAITKINYQNMQTIKALKHGPEFCQWLLKKINIESSS